MSTHILQLQVWNHRCFESLTVDFGPKINCLQGYNAQGKTSILEAIYLAGTGKSFRVQNHKYIQKLNTESCCIKMQIANMPNNYELAYYYKEPSSMLTYNREHIKRSQVMQLLPIKLYLTSDLQTFFLPEKRRKYIDWLAFYCFPEFTYHYGRYLTALANYRLAIRSNFDINYLAAIQLLLDKHAERVNHYRQISIELLRDKLNIISDYKVKIIYDCGWYGSFRDYSKCMVSSKSNLLQGPHRADINFYINEVDVKLYASRGQLKAFIYCLNLAQDLVLKQHNLPCIHLIDDLPAELDKSSMQKILKKLHDINSQVIFTSCPNKDLNKFSLHNITITRSKLL